MEEKEIRIALKNIMEEVKDDVTGYCEWAMIQSRERGEVVSAACYAFLAERLKDYYIDDGDNHSDEQPF